MAGRPPLQIGHHGKITRQNLGGGVWLARCKYRDADGVTRRVERRSPVGQLDKYGKLAVDALIDALKSRRPPGAVGEISLDTKITALIEQHLTRLADDGRSPATMSSYKTASAKLGKFLGGVRVGEATPARIDAAIRSMRSTHGAVMARQSKTVLKGALQLAVMANVLGSNPVRDVAAIRAAGPVKGASAMTAEQLRDLLVGVQASQYCHERDLVDPIIVLIATGLRRSELLALRWVDLDVDAGTLTVAGKVVRVAGVGLERIDETKTAAGRRVVALPSFALEALKARKGREYVGEQGIIFPSSAGTLRDPNNFGKQWRAVRDDLGVPEVTTHSFRKSMATLIDDGGLSARVGADQLGHSKVSITQDIYQQRGRVHAEVAALLDRAIKGE